MYIREKYLNKLIEYKDTEFIKVITGVRRSGKSYLLHSYLDYLVKNNISEDNILYLSMELYHNKK